MAENLDETKAEPSPYDHGDTSYDPALDEVPSTPSPVQAKKPAPAVAPTAAPALSPSKPKHPSGLVRRAMRYGATSDQIDKVSTDELDDWVERMDLQRESEREASQRETSVRNSVETARTAPARQAAEPEPEADDLAELEQELHPKLAKVLKEQRNKIKELEAGKKRLDDLEGREVTRQQQALFDVYDSAFDELGRDSKFKKVYGEGAGVDLEANGEERRRREAILKAAGIDLTKDSPKQIKRKIHSAHELIYGKAAAAEQEPETASYGAPALGKSNGKPRITKEQWDEGSLATPTQRKAKEPKGYNRALRAVTAEMKENGLMEDDFSQVEENGLPE